MANSKTKAARLSIISNTSLIVLKVIAGIASGSVSIISEAIHSSIDLAAAVIAFFSVRVSDNPPDTKHPYGHGKIENISGVIEALLISVAAVWIIVEAVKKIIQGQIELEMVATGIAVMAVSAIVNAIVCRKLYKTARETGSIALEADALHLKTDVYTSAGVAAGLALIMLTDIKWLDPVVAIIVALFIFFESYKLLKRAFLPLLDTAWNEEDIASLEKRLENLGVNYHALRTRVAGAYIFVDLHIKIPENASVGESHKYCDEIEADLEGAYPNMNVTIHVEPA